MDGGGDDPFIQQVLQEIQQKIASETARHTERLESERADIERRIKERNVEIGSNLDMIQTCLSTIREAEEANATLAQHNNVDEQRMEEIGRIIETAAKERPQQLLSNLKSKLTTPATPRASITEISRPQPKGAVRLAGDGVVRKREPRTESEQVVPDSDQPQAPQLSVRRSGRSVKPVEHLLDTYFTEEPQARIKVSESPSFPEKLRAKKRAPVERDDASQPSQSPAPKKRAKRESSSMYVALDAPKEEVLAGAAVPSPDEISPPANVAQEPRPKKKRPTSSKGDKPASKRTKTVTPKMESDDEEKISVRKMVPDPVVGQVYQIEWCRKPWTAVVLPTGDLGEVGMSGTLADTGLAPPWPGCYRLFKPRNAEPYMGFKFDYRDGNTRSHLRKYPIMYLEEEMVVPLDPATKFEPPKYNPGKYSTYDWVRADQLKPFDLDDPESRKLKGFATTKSFMRRLVKIKDIKAESRTTTTTTTSTGREAIQGLADIIINDNEDDSDYYEESSGLSDNDDQDGEPGDGEGDGESSDDEPRTMGRAVRKRGPARTQSRRSTSRPKSTSRATKASRRSSEAEKWAGQHAQSQLKPGSDAESDSDLSSVSDEPMSAEGLKRSSSSAPGEGLMADAIMPEPPETGKGDSGKSKIEPNTETRKSLGSTGTGIQSFPVEVAAALSLKPSVAKSLSSSSSGGTDALDGLATAAVALADQTKAVVPSGPGAITHSRQSSRSDYQSAPASPLLPAPLGVHKMRMENFLRPGPTPPVDRSDSNSPTRSIMEYGSYQKTHDFGAPIGRRGPEFVSSSAMQPFPGAPLTPISRESSSSGHARKSSSSFVNRMVN